MEIGNIVDYSSVASFDGYNFCIHTKRKWDTAVTHPDVTMGEEHVLPCFTVDDVMIHNKEVGQRDWFKYGQKVYSIEQIKMVLQVQRTPENDDESEDDSDDDSDDCEDSDKRDYSGINLEGGYPVYNLRKAGISKVELQAVLDKSVVGSLVNVDKYTQLVKCKNWVEDILKGMKNSKNVFEESGNVTDFRDQLNRWLNDYPCVENDRYKHPVNCVDHNDNFFPLPAPILCNPLVLRQWVEEWQSFDFQVPAEGVWQIRELLNEDIGDTHEVFADVVKSHVDDTIEDFDMEIDGEAAWNVLEEDVVKSDITTPQQDRIWKNREFRTNLKDPEWMRKRRKEIGDRMAKRHRWSADRVAPYMSFCCNLERGWNAFQKLCR